MARYRLNTTKYVLKGPKKHQKVPIFNKITLFTLSDPPPPLGLSTFLKLIIFTLRNFFILAYPHLAIPPYQQNVDDLLCFFATLP